MIKKKSSSFSEAFSSWFLNDSPGPRNNCDVSGERRLAAYVAADVLPVARRRNMKVICWFEDVFRRDVRGFDKAVEIDAHGRPTALA